jgi:hypothetical protein
VTGQRGLIGRLPRSCIRYQSQENLLKRTKIVLALPSNNRQRLSGIRRGWCPPQSRRGTERVIRSDVGVTHRLSLSARVVSAVDRQVKAKQRDEKRLWHRRNLSNRRTRSPVGQGPRAPKAANLAARCSTLLQEGFGAGGLEPAESIFYPDNIRLRRLLGCGQTEFLGPRHLRPVLEPVAPAPQLLVSLPSAFAVDRNGLSCRDSAGLVHRASVAGPVAADPRPAGRGIRATNADGKTTRAFLIRNARRGVSILVVLVLIIIVVGLAGSVRLAALIVPELAVHAIGGEQFRVRAPLDRPAA